MEQIEFGPLTDELRSELEGDEQDPWDAARVPPMEWRPKERHVGLRDEHGRLVANAGLLVVDTLSTWARLGGDDENSSGKAAEAMAPLQLAAATGIAVLVLRHDRKSGGDVGDSARGSSAFGGAVDIILALRRGEGNSRPTIRALHGLSRFDETPATLMIELTDSGYVALGSQTAVAVLSGARPKTLS